MASKKYDFKKPLLNPDGEPLKENNEDLMMHKTLSAFIMGSTVTEGTLKFFDWGLQLRKDGILTLDETDRDLLKNFLLTHPRLVVLEKGRYNEVLKKGE